MEKCIELLNEAKDELKDVEGSEEVMAKINEVITEVEDLYSGSESSSLDKEEQDMMDSGKYARGPKSGIMIEIGLGKKKQ